MTEPPDRLRISLVKTFLPQQLYDDEEACTHDQAQQLRFVRRVLGNSSLQGAGDVQLNNLFGGRQLGARKARVSELVKELQLVPGIDHRTFASVLRLLAGLRDTAPPSTASHPRAHMQAPQQQPKQPPQRPAAPTANGHHPNNPLATREEMLPALRAVLAAGSGIAQHPVSFDAFNVHGQYTLSQMEGVHLSRPQQRLLEQCCEFGRFYRQITVYVQQGKHRQLDTMGSAVLTALRGGLSLQLVEALQLLARLQALTTTSSAAGAGTSSGKLTHIQLYTELQPKCQDLRFLASAVQNVAETRQGGVVLGQLYTHAEHGSQHVHKLMMGLLQQAALPMLRSLHAWAFEGKLQGAPGDIFISGKTGLAAQQQNRLRKTLIMPAETSGKEVWSARYQTLDSVRPHFISAELAATVLRCGKGLIFLRECCGEEDWAAAFEGSNESVAAQNLNVDQMEELEQVYTSAAAKVDQHLLALLTTKYRCKDYLLAFKRYILLSQGDFRKELMENVTAQLERAAGQVNHSQLSRALHDAVQHSLAKFDDLEPTHRLAFSLAPAHKHVRGAESGWDVFSLQFRLAEPLATLMPAAIARGYEQLQQLLLRIEQAQHALCRAWSHFRTSQHCLNTIQRLNRAAGTTVPGVARVSSALAQAQALRSTMASFMLAFQSYVKLEVVESSANAFFDSLAAVGNLDALIAAHGAHVDGMVQQALLKEDPVQYNLRSLMALMRGLQTVAEDLSKQVSGASKELQEHLSQRRRNTKKGEWAIGSMDPALQGIESGPLAGNQTTLDNLEREFLSGEESLVSMLPAHLDMRYLLFRLKARHEGATPSRNTTPLDTPRGR